MTDNTVLLWNQGYKKALDAAEAIVKELCADTNVLAHSALLQRLESLTHHQINGVQDLYARTGYETAISELKFACENAIENGYPTAYDTEFLQVLADARANRDIDQEA